MTCAYCAFTGHRREVHAHLTDEHAAEVDTSFDEATERMFFRVSCPKCGHSMEKRVKPRYRHPEFLEEFSREIRLVAFDILLYHLEDHEPGRDEAPEGKR
ncbi:MAG: hypothetical protein ACREQ9_20745 [Candidatus Binatia bacterium]